MAPRCARLGRDEPGAHAFPVRRPRRQSGRTRTGAARLPHPRRRCHPLDGLSEWRHNSPWCGVRPGRGRTWHAALVSTRHRSSRESAQIGAPSCSIASRSCVITSCWAAAVAARGTICSIAACPATPSRDTGPGRGARDDADPYGALAASRVSPRGDRGVRRLCRLAVAGPAVRSVADGVRQAGNRLGPIDRR